MAREASTVRMGPISLFTLAVALCLAVMSVLSITTAQATYSAAYKQATFTEDTYKNESAAQELLASLDAALAPVRAAGAGTVSAYEAVDGALPDNAQREGSVVRVQFTAESGRSLTIELTIRSDATYEINTWKATTEWTTSTTDETLWSPGAQTG